MAFNMFKEMTKEVKKEVRQEREKSVIEYISINKLIPSQDNFYSVNDVIDLMQSIELLGGITQNLTVCRIPDTDTYKIIEGHRRHEASRRLVAEDKPQFELVPCVVKKAAITEYEKILEEMQLIYSNSATRQLTDYEKTQQVTRLKVLLKQLKKEGIKITGRTREIIADALDTSTAHIGRMQSIEKNLLEKFKQEFKDQNIGISVAYEISVLPKEQQEQVFEEYKNKGELSIKDIKKQKQPPAPPAQLTEPSKPLPVSNSMTVHELKILLQYYEPVKAGLKKFEFRLNDRGYKVGDVLQLNEWNKHTLEFTGRTITAEITYILGGELLPPDYVILSIEVISWEG